MEKSVPIDTGSEWTKLYFKPYMGSNGFRGYLDIVTTTPDGQTKISLRVFRDKNEYYAADKASHFTPLFNEDGSPLRDDMGKPMSKENQYGKIDQLLKTKVKLWLSATLPHFFEEHPDGKVAEYPAANAQHKSKTRNSPTIVAHNEDESATIPQGGY